MDIDKSKMVKKTLKPDADPLPYPLSLYILRV